MVQVHDCSYYSVSDNRYPRNYCIIPDIPRYTTRIYNNEMKQRYYIIAVANQLNPNRQQLQYRYARARMYRYYIVQLKTNIGKFVRRDLKIYFFPRLLFLSPEMHDVHNIRKCITKCVCDIGRHRWLKK